MKPQTIEEIMADLAAGDPLDLSELSLREEDVRALMAAHLCEVDQQLAESGVPCERRLEIMAAIAAHAMVENMLLNVARLKRAGSQAEFHAWLRRHGLEADS